MTESRDGKYEVGIDDEKIHLRDWLEEILHVHFYDGKEWETVDKWLADPSSFDIFGDPFREELPRDNPLQTRRWRLPNGTIIADAVNETALKLLKTRPDKYFKVIKRKQSHE